jgi:hypothetical protein
MTRYVYVVEDDEKFTQATFPSKAKCVTYLQGQSSIDGLFVQQFEENGEMVVDLETAHRFVKAHKK